MSNPSSHQPLFTLPYLMSEWVRDYNAWCVDSDAALIGRLRKWTEQKAQKETVAQSSFEQRFFVELWGYTQSGAESKDDGYTLHAQYPVKNAGQGGGTGKADLAMGWFEHPKLLQIPQVLCEFKDERSGLDANQKREANSRSPVEQCADYLKHARDEHDRYGNSKIKPTWGIVSDMQEFRLYWQAQMPRQYERFVIRDMLAAGESARQQRFLFSRLFHRDWLLDRGNGSPLLKLLSSQRIREKSLEKTFYFEYRAYRDHLYRALLAANPDYQTKPRILVRLTQKLLDRFLFVLFCEDMGAHLDYPVNLLRDLLIEASNSESYAPEAPDLWDGKIKRLFRCMRDGQSFSGKTINRFNGGLFSEDAALDTLTVPDRVLCAHNQGQNEASLVKYPLTLLYFSSAYNFGIEDGGDRAIGLYTLGRIFEQSITDLEILEAEAANAPSLMKLGKRKTDGVYYTPEWVSAYIVEETLGLRLRELRAQLPERPDANQINDDHTKTLKFKNKETLSARYFAALEAYEKRVGQLKILDPACGSGAFLIQALRRLIVEHEWIAAEKSYVSYHHKQSGLFDTARVYREILGQNLYGVDVNAESVEITKLALWLHTALPGKPLSTLDDHIVCGNSLVDSAIEKHLGMLTVEQRGRINPFDYHTTFSDVFEAGGFDVVIGNPPYIKLQNMRQIQSEATDYWLNAKGEDGQPKFKSAQTGNYDIYLLFIEQGSRLLKPEGRMGYIAPNVWAVNEYGEGLRGWLSETRQLDRWIDFNDFQIFDEAITYTALQFFTDSANDGIRLHFAPRGSDDLAALDWNIIPARPYASLPKNGAWEFMPELERLLIEKLRQQCQTLEQCSIAIYQGLITSADSLYHLEKVTDGKYRSFADKTSPAVVEIEDALMKPLVSGPEAKRYQAPRTDTWLLFPYDLTGNKPALYSAQSMQTTFPKGWAYLQRHETALRGRENSKMDKEGWYQFGRNQNIDKQECAKLIVAQTVPSLRVCFDNQAEFFLNNVRVNGILPKADNGWFLLGVLNASVADFVFKRIAKVKEGGFYEANKQFIAPLPIPGATPAQVTQVADQAHALQTLHTQYRDKRMALTRTLAAKQLSDATKTPDALFGESVKAKTIEARATLAAPGLKGTALKRWVNDEIDKLLTIELEALSTRLRPGVKLEVVQGDGEIALKADAATAFTIYVDQNECAFIAAQWRQVIRTTSITPSLTARKLLDALLNLKTTDLDPLRNNITTLDAELVTMEKQIVLDETTLNTLVYKLYGLNDAEIKQIERG